MLLSAVPRVMPKMCIRDSIEKGAQVIALFNFRNISFLNEVQTEITTPVTDILQACIEELKKNPVKKLGYLGRPGTDKAKLITETVSREVPVEWVYPSEAMLEVFDELESGSHCAVTVSYTHLDVYKRQATARAVFSLSPVSIQTSLPLACMASIACLLS